MSCLTDFNNDLLWITIIFSILFLALYLYQKKNSTNDFVRDFTNAASVSLTFLLIIFVGYHCFPSEDSLFSKLVSGEVIVGVTVAFPTFYTWYRRDKKETADSEAHQEEQKKIQKERYKYQKYTEIKSDYLTWNKNFSIDNMSQILTIVNLEQIIERVEEFYKISENKEMHPIDFTSLFIMIQEILKEWSKSNKYKESSDRNKINSIYDSWRKLNNKIISNMSNVPDHAKNAEEVYALDFSKNSSIFREYTRSSKFYGCKFKPENFDDYLSNDGFYEFYDTFMERKLYSYELSKIGDDVKLERYFYEDDFGNILLSTTEQKDVKQDNSSQEKPDEEQGSEGITPATNEVEPLEQSNSELSSREIPIYENRDLSDFGEINKFVECQQSIKVTINDDKSSIKQQIFDALKRLEKTEFDTMTKDNSFVSKSKNFIPDMKKKDKKKWDWYSWNVLTEMKIKDEKIKFFIFAVDTSDIDSDKNFECIVIKKENLSELLKLKSMTKDSRYFFYFAKEK